MPNVTEFIYFQLKDSVKPEDSSNDEGYSLLQLFNATKQQSGHLGSAWGRTKEDKNVVVWAVDWSDAHGGVQQSSAPLPDFIAPNTQITTIFTTLQPTDIDTESAATATLSSNPITELTPLAFPTTLSPDERHSLSADLVTFRKALVEEAEENVRAKTFLSGQVERPGEFPHDKSQSGQVFVHFVALGWDTFEQHQEAKGLEAFGKTIAPIREKMVAPLEKLGMKHVEFQKI
ncbi:hypothetical protein BJX99DRAFT_236525 [Aspergillus californicus]